MNETSFLDCLTSIPDFARGSTQIAFRLFAVGVVLISLSAVLKSAEQDILPVCVIGVHATTGKTEGSVVSVFGQRGATFSGFVARWFSNGTDTTICEYVVDATSNERHVPIGIDSSGSKVVIETSTLLGQTTGLLLYDLTTQHVDAEYIESRVLPTIASGLVAIVLDLDSKPDSVQVFALNLSTGERRGIANLGKTERGNYESEIFVVGDRLFVAENGAYSIIRVETGEIESSGLISPTMRSAIDEGRVVIDLEAKLLVYDYSASSRTANAIDVTTNQTKQLSLPFELQSDDAELVLCNVTSGVFVFRYRNGFEQEVFVDGSAKGVKKWSILGAKNFVETVHGTDWIVVGATGMVSLLNVAVDQRMDIATTLDPLFVRFLGAGDRLLLSEGLSNIVFDYSSNLVTDFAPSYTARVNDVNGVTYSCSYSNGKTYVSVDSVDNIAAPRNIIELNHARGCRLIAIANDESLLVSVSSDSAFVYSLPAIDRVGAFVVDATMGSLGYACVAPDANSFFVVGKEGSTHSTVLNNQVVTELVPSVYTGHAMQAPVGCYYQDSVGHVHMVFRPSSKLIGDYNLSSKTTQTLNPTGEAVRHVIVDDLGMALLIQGNAKAFWYDVPRQIALDDIQMDGVREVVSADYSFEKNVFAFRSTNNVIIKSLPVTSVESNYEPEQADAEEVEVKCTDGSVVVTSNYGEIVSANMFDLRGMLLSSASIRSADKVAIFEDSSVGTQAMCVIVADVIRSGNLARIGKIVYSCCR